MVNIPALARLRFLMFPHFFLSNNGEVGAPDNTVLNKLRSVNCAK